jgi:hypothetical protein
MQQHFREQIRVERHDQLEQHKARAATAAAKVAVLKEEQKLLDLRSESLLLESKLKEQRQQVLPDGTPRHPIPSPEKVVEAYNRLSYRR